MIRVKMCGFTRMEDVKAAAALGVDAFGFNFAKGPRKITPEDAFWMTQVLPPFAQSVALFVNQSEDEILDAMERSRCSVVQLHGDEMPELAHRVGERYPVIKAFRVRDEKTLALAASYPCQAVLLDAYVPGEEGGTGATWDHSLVGRTDFDKPVIVAGGLTADNVADAISATKPYAVDTASGVELEPAIKSVERMQAFMKACGR